jgi:xylulokinase
MAGMVLVFDIGTSAVKGGLVNEAGRLVAGAGCPVDPLATSDPRFHEVDPLQWLEGVRQVASRLLARHPGQVLCAVVSGNGPTLVPADAGGQPTCPAINWLDRRAIEESRLIGEATGSYVDPSFFLPKAYWIHRRRPEIYAATRWFFSCPEYIDFMLTGNAHTVLPSAPFSRYIWTEEAIGRLGMDRDKFPPFVPPGAAVGRVARAAAARLGVPAGLPVIAGGPDFIMSLLGTATVRPGRVCDRGGSSEGVNLCARAPVEDRRLLVLPHIVSGLYNISGLISTTGQALDWFRRVTGRRGRRPDACLEEIGRAPAGAARLLFLPYLAGERSPLWDPHARGCFLGLTLKHTGRELGRAVVESVGYAIRDVLEVMGENGLAVEEMRVSGGQARSPVWNRIKADITGRRILEPAVHDSELVGDACLGFSALAGDPDLAAAAERLVRIRRVHEPDPRLRPLYDEMFGLYREAYDRLKGLFRQLSAGSGAEEP